MKLWNLDMVWMISQNERKMTGWRTGSFEQKRGSTRSSGTHRAPTHFPYLGQQAEGRVTWHYFMSPTVVTSAVQQHSFTTRILVKTWIHKKTLDAFFSTQNRGHKQCVPGMKHPQTMINSTQSHKARLTVMAPWIVRWLHEKFALSLVLYKCLKSNQGLCLSWFFHSVKPTPSPHTTGLAVSKVQRPLLALFCLF